MKKKYAIFCFDESKTHLVPARRKLSNFEKTVRHNLRAEAPDEEDVVFEQKEQAESYIEQQIYMMAPFFIIESYSLK